MDLNSYIKAIVTEPKKVRSATYKALQYHGKELRKHIQAKIPDYFNLKSKNRFYSKSAVQYRWHKDKQEGFDSFAHIFLAERPRDIKSQSHVGNIHLWKHEGGGYIDEALIPTLSASKESESGEFGRRQKKVNRNLYLNKIAKGKFFDNPKMTDKQKIAWMIRLGKPKERIVKLSTGYYSVTGGGYRKSKKRKGELISKPKVKRIYTSEKISSKIKGTHFFEKEKDKYLKNVNIGKEIVKNIEKR